MQVGRLESIRVIRVSEVSVDSVFHSSKTV